MVADDAEQPDGAQEQALQDDEEAALMLDVAAGDAEADDGTPGDVVAAPVAENLSDLDDDELDQYLCTEEEVKMKKQIWMISNKYVYLPCRCVLFSLSSVVLLH